MNKSKVLAERVFLVSLLVFIISIIPATYTTSSILLGAAGQPANPPEESTSPLTPISDGISIISGLVAVLSSFYAIQTTRSETKRKEIDRDMQLREVEILKLELALEKERKKNKSVIEEEKGQKSKKSKSGRRKTN